jgi:hypothetical protein
MFAVGSWLMGASLAATPSGNSSRRADHVTSPVRIPVRILSGFLVVAQGQIGSGSQGQNFIIDTGTSPSLLNSRVAQQLHLPSIPARFAAMGRESEIRAVRLPQIKLGPLRASSKEFLVVDLSEVERNWKLPIAGILGLDILGETSFLLDYENQVLEFGNISAEGMAVSLSADNRLPIARVNINGKPLRLLVDTGSDRLVFFGNQGAQDLGVTAGDGLLPGKSVNGDVAVRGISSLEVEWNGARFRQAGVIVPGRQEPLFDGLLSVRSLGFRSIAVSAETHTIYLRK